MQQMRAEGLMATPGGAGGAASSEAQPGTPAEAGAGGPAPKEGAGTRRILREVFLKAKDGSWQVRCCGHRCLNESNLRLLPTFCLMLRMF